MSAIFNNLLVTGNSRLTGSQSIGESGEIKEGDHRAVTGDGIYNFLNYSHKRVFYFENGYNQATVPIVIDDIVKKTRTISIQVLLSQRSLNIPTCIQLYDPDNWLSSVNTNHSKVMALDIYVSPLGCRGGFAGHTILYFGNHDYKISVAVNSGSNNNFSAPDMEFTRPLYNDPDSVTKMADSQGSVFLFRLWKIYDQDEQADRFSLDTGIYKEFGSLSVAGRLKYL